MNVWAYVCAPSWLCIYVTEIIFLVVIRLFIKTELEITEHQMVATAPAKQKEEV